MDGYVETQDRPVAPADDRSLAQLQEVHQAEDVRRHQIVAVGPLVARAASVAAAVHDDYPIVPGQYRYLIAPIVRVGEPAVQQQHRLAAAERGVPDPDAVYRGVASLRRLRQARCRRKRQPLLLATSPSGARQDRQ